MFDNNDKETIKDVSKDITNTTNDINMANDGNFLMETIVISDDVEIPSDRGYCSGHWTFQKVKNNIR